MSSSAKKGDEITLKIPSLVRRNDKVYLIKSTRINQIELLHLNLSFNLI